METKANHVLVGAFTILVALAGLVLIGWLAKGRVSQDYVEYRIIFHGSVTGLNEGSDVRYNGIKVGSVQSLDLSPNSPSDVVVGIRVYPTTPIHSDSVASIGYQGLTGIAYVQISGGTPTAPLLRAASKERTPVIRSRPSGFEQLVAGAPDLLAGATQLVQQLNRFTGAENQKTFTDMLKHLEAISGSIAAHQSDTDQILANGAAISRQLAETATKLNSLSDRLNRIADRASDTVDTTDRLMRGDGAAFFHEARLAAASYRRTGEALQALLEQNRTAINSFSGQGLSDLTRLASDTRQLVATLDRLAQRMENEPARFLLGHPVPEYQPR